MILAIRLAPALFFYYLALILHEAFYIGSILLILEAIVEIYFLHKRGYAIIEDDKITKMNLLGQKSIETEDVLSTFVYNDEWTFRSQNQEIRLDKNFVKKEQQSIMVEKMAKLREKSKFNH